MTIDLDRFREFGLEDTCCVSSVLRNEVVLSNFYVTGIARQKMMIHSVA